MTPMFDPKRMTPETTPMLDPKGMTPETTLMFDLWVDPNG